MNQTIIAATFTTADGSTFNTRKEANDHQAYLNRVEKVRAVIAADPDANDMEVAALIAKHADALVAALNNPLNRGRKASAEA